MPPNEVGRATFTVPIADIKFDASGDPEAKGSWTMRGHAAVFDQMSHDMGGFRVKIAPGYFTNVLQQNPDVHLLWDHDTRYVLARTKNNSLELKQDEVGLRVWARFAKTQSADELATLMQGGFVDQMSFATNVGKSEWIEDDAGNITWHLLEADTDGGLTDVTVTAQGAFPQTSSHLAASVKDAGLLLASAREAGFLAAREGSGDSTGIDPEALAQKLAFRPDGAADVAGESRGGRDLAAFKAEHLARFAQLTHPD